MATLAVKITRWNGELDQDNIKAVTKDILVPVVMKSCYINVVHGYSCAPKNDSNFHINIWSHPKNAKRGGPQAPSKILGHNVSCRDCGYEYDVGTNGLPLTDPRTGHIYGELLNDNLYIYHDIVHCGYTQELTLYKNIMEVVAAIYGNAGTLQKLTIKKACELDLQVLPNVQKSKEKKEGVSVLEAKLIELTRQADELTQKLSIAKSMEIISNPSMIKKSEKFAKDCAAIRKLPQIEETAYTKTGITFSTKPLIAKSKTGKITYSLGKFLIHLDLINYQILCRNREIIVSTSLGDTMHAPMIGSSGLLMGPAIVTIPKLLISEEYLKAVQFVLRTIENPTFVYSKYLKNWPKKNC